MSSSRRVVKKLRKLRERSDVAHAFLEWLATFERNIDHSTVNYVVDRVTRHARDEIDEGMTVSRAEIIAVMKELDALEVGRFVVGRRGAESRFEFWVHRGQIGKAAIGQIESIDLDEEPAALKAEEIVEAHRMLIANSLRTAVENVKITIREGADA